MLPRPLLLATLPGGSRSCADKLPLDAEAEEGWGGDSWRFPAAWKTNCGRSNARLSGVKTVMWCHAPEDSG